MVILVKVIILWKQNKKQKKQIINDIRIWLFEATKSYFFYSLFFYDRNVADKIYNIGDWSDVMLINEKYDVKMMGVFEWVLYGEQNRLYEF